MAIAQPIIRKVAIISDTHNMLRPEVMCQLEGCEQILHAGDISSERVLRQLKQVAPVTVVRGNNDKEWAEGIPETVSFSLEGIRVFMVHNKKDIPLELMREAKADLIIFGHSHRYEDRMEKGIRFINPGSCGPRRFGQDITMAMMYLEEESGFRIEKILIPHPEKSVARKGAGAEKAESRKNSSADIPAGIPANIRAMIPEIMKEVDARKTVKQIARKHRISAELAEQIVRMYLTHPGVNVDGIMRRIGL